MAQIAYLLVSDLHDQDRNIDNRYDYPGEVMQVKDKILELGLRYHDMGYEVNLILLGDVYNRSYKNVTGAILANNFWIVANRVFTKIYSVMGNHETTYYSSNPFFTLVNSVDSMKIQTLNKKVWQPLGLFNVIDIPDFVEVGNVAFHFNHYGCPITIPEKGVYNIGLFHTDFVFSEIAQASENTNNMHAFIKNSVSANNNELLELYDACFFAHHHKLYGCWNVTTNSGHSCTIEHLASLGRPNVSEVDDNFLERDIPAVIIEDNKFSEIQHNFITLPGRASCVKEDVVKEKQQSYERVKAMKAAINYVPDTDDPIKNIRTAIMGDPLSAKIVDELLHSNVDSQTRYVLQEISEVL